MYRRKCLLHSERPGVYWVRPSIVQKFKQEHYFIAKKMLGSICDTYVTTHYTLQGHCTWRLLKWYCANIKLNFSLSSMSKLTWKWVFTPNTQSKHMYVVSTTGLWGNYYVLTSFATRQYKIRRISIWKW